jgi:hypothetical protein
MKTDIIVERVVSKLRSRSATGISKYNTTLGENDKDNFLSHLQEELLDAANYIEKLMSQSSQVEIDFLELPTYIASYNSPTDVCTLCISKDPGKTLISYVYPTEDRTLLMVSAKNLSEALTRMLELLDQKVISKQIKIIR